MKVLLRLWDLFFYNGSTVIFQITMGMLKLKVLIFLCTLTWYVVSTTVHKNPTEGVILSDLMVLIYILFCCCCSINGLSSEWVMLTGDLLIL